MTLVLVISFVIHESEISSGITLISSDKSSTLVVITCVNVSILRSVDDNRELKQIRRRRKRERQVKM